MGTSAQALPTAVFRPIPTPILTRILWQSLRQQQQQQAAPVQPSQPVRRRASLSSSDDDDDSERSRRANFVPITPTGMESRSAYKQKDDLKVLWKGALGNSAVQAMASRDERMAQQLTQIDVSLPSESSRGSFNVSQRLIRSGVQTGVAGSPGGRIQVNQAAERPGAVLLSLSVFVQQLCQGAANRWLPRKQEMDYAGIGLEKQLAAADLSSAQVMPSPPRKIYARPQFELSEPPGLRAARPSSPGFRELHQCRSSGSGQWWRRGAAPPLRPGGRPKKDYLAAWNQCWDSARAAALPEAAPVAENGSGPQS